MNIVQYTEIEYWQNDQRENIAYSNKLENRIDELEEESFDNIMDKIHLEFYERHVVIVGDDGTRKYHKYGCDDLDTSCFWVYNTEKAEQLGYYACPKCH